MVPLRGGARCVADCGGRAGVVAMINYTLHPGDVLDVVSGLPDNTYSAVFCDPPYGLGKTPDMTEVLTHWLAGDDYRASGGGFMGKAWDSSVPGPSVWKEIYRVCKPGAVLLAFGGTRTADLLSIAIRLAGWQRWDELMYIYGSGFPKGHDISKAIDKAAGAEREVIGVKRSGIGRNGRDDFDVFHSTCDESLKRVSITAPATPEAATWAGYNVALKPAFEPILCFRKPLESTYAHSALTYGTGALNVDGCRVPISDGATMARNNKPGDNGWKNSSGGANNAALHGEPNGRWPANLIHSGDPEVMEVFDRAGVRRSSCHVNASKAKHGSGFVSGTTGGYATPGENTYSDSGSAARFFYCAKSSASERSAGLDGSNPHPTVKPLSLCEYIAKLIVPPEPYRDDAKLLIPYAGSGSEAIGAMQAGWRNITGIELDSEYCVINRKRFDYWAEQAQTVQPALLEVA